MNYIQRIAEDLTTLEVNTIVKSNMTGGKMPSSKRRALLEIADLYRERLVAYGLCRYGADEPEDLSENDEPHAAGRLLRWRFGGEYSFIEIRHHARKGIDYYNGLLDKNLPEDKRNEVNMRKAILMRLFRQSGNLIGLFKARREEFAAKIEAGSKGFSGKLNDEGIGGSDLLYRSQRDSEGWNNDIAKGHINSAVDMALRPDQIALVRKVWEIGTEQILMQTSVQIDGDVTSFISQQLLNFPAEAKKTFMSLHDESVRTSTGIWMQLFKLVGDLAGKAIGQIFPNK